jgi:hypothetical protein
LSIKSGLNGEEHTMKVLTRIAVVGLAFLLPAGAFAVPMTDLIGDKDCFGTLGACVEDGVTWLPGAWPSVTQGVGDPPFTDKHFNTSTTQMWTHTVGAGAYTSALLTFRTAGIADIAGPYGVFVDGVLVGQMPLDGFGHILVETFSFAFNPALLLDGAAVVSFTPGSSDTWAIDYSELTYTVPEPASAGLLGLGIAGLGWLRRRKSA